VIETIMADKGYASHDDFSTTSNFVNAWQCSRLVIAAL